METQKLKVVSKLNPNVKSFKSALTRDPPVKLLNNRWVTWFYMENPDIKVKTNMDYLSGLRYLGTAYSIDTFWKYLTIIPAIHDIKHHITIHLHREGVLPLWEAREHVKGSSILFRTWRENAQEMWEFLCCMMTGLECLQCMVPGEEMLGVSFRIKEDKRVHFEIWMTGKRSYDSVLKYIEMKRPGIEIIGPYHSIHTAHLTAKHHDVKRPEPHKKSTKK